ncbi:hypothetical protein LZ30DRAFT_266233 [Colletotrichum cereale]|nr:hypothetical protein LZ30DRAFT_266233 [Colletotrichum cereale]
MPTLSSRSMFLRIPALQRIVVVPNIDKKLVADCTPSHTSQAASPNLFKIDVRQLWHMAWVSWVPVPGFTVPSYAFLCTVSYAFEMDGPLLCKRGVCLPQPGHQLGQCAVGRIRKRGVLLVRPTCLGSRVESLTGCMYSYLTSTFVAMYSDRDKAHGAAVKLGYQTTRVGNQSIHVNIRLCGLN